MIQSKHDRLVHEARRLKKAWLLAAAIVGVEGRVGKAELVIPAYVSWENKALKRQISNLESDFAEIARHFLLDGKPSPKVVTWCARQYDEWQRTGLTIFDLGRVHEVEAAIGPLSLRRHMECPPYAQVLLQGFAGSAIRHPEYHLASDLSLLWNLYLDSEDIFMRSAREGGPVHLEHGQSLGRSVIITCYNLLESFVSGLATAWLMENPQAPPETVKKMSENKGSLRSRFFEVPSLILGRRDLLDESQPVFRDLFGTFKQRRDAFVHCEPGPRVTKLGYVKEQHFHDVDMLVVKATVDATHQAICTVWKFVHGRDGPRWLRMRGSNGRFPRVFVTLHSSPQTSTRADHVTSNV